MKNIGAYYIFWMNKILICIITEFCAFKFIWVLTSLLTLHRSYNDGQFYGQRKPVVGQSSVQ